MFSIIKNIEVKFKLLSITKMPFYAVAKGRETGIFTDWNECQAQIFKFSGAIFKKFKSKAEAEKFLSDNNHKSANSTTNKLHAKQKFINISRSSFKKSDSDHNRSLPSALESRNDDDKKNSSLESKNDLFDDDFDQDLIEEIDKAEKNASKASAKATATLAINKRKQPISSSAQEPEYKRTKYESIVYESVGLKKFGDYEFPIDENGFVIVYTDGACENNGKSSAAAGFGVYFNDNHPLNASKPVDGRATNNCGEIQAAIYALNIAKEYGIDKILINTDSQFLLNSATKWIWNWKAKGWKLKSGDDVKNTAEFQKLYPLLMDKNLRIKWNYTKGHDGIKGNVEADALAVNGAQIYKRYKQ